MRHPRARAILRAATSGSGRWWIPSVLYLLVVLVVYAVGVAIGTFVHGEPTLATVVYEPLLFPVLFLYAPPAMAAVAAVRDAPPVAALALGLSVGIAFATLGIVSSLLGTSGNGDSSLWALSIAFAGTGAVTAVAGFALGSAPRLVAERLA